MPRKTKVQNQQEHEEQLIKDGLESAPYSDTEKSYFSFLRQRLTAAKEQRDLNWDEMDGMPYTLYYDTNAKAGNSYNPPKVNEDDTKIVTGTTLEKSNALLNAVLNLNLEPDIEAYDKEDLPYQSLADTMEIMVKKSRKIEGYEKKRRLIYKEAMDQGTWFVEEVNIQKEIVEKELLKKNYQELAPDQMTWTEVVKSVYSECSCNLLNGLKVFLGNMKEFLIEEQPFVFTVEYIPYSVAEKKFGKFDRFKYVPRVVTKIVETEKDSGETNYRSWRLFDVNQKMVEVIKYQDKWANEYQIMLNGVMMLKPGFPLSALTGDGEYSIVKGDLEPISKFFAISKSFPAKTKVPQAVLDEFIRLIVLKTQKSYAPPLANRTGRVLSKKIFRVGEITPNLNPDDIKEIGTNNGITQPEVMAYQLVKGTVDEMTVSSQFQGLEGKGKTATQTLEDKKQNLMKIGMAVIGIVLFEQELVYRRIQNILQNWTKPIDSEIDEVKNELVNTYRQITDVGEMNGVRGINQVIMTDQNYKTAEDVMMEEDMMSRQYNMPVKRIYLNPELLRSLKYRWYVEISPSEKQTSEFKSALLRQKITDAVMIFGPQSLNYEALRDRYAQMIGEDPQVFFLKSQPASPDMNQIEPVVKQNRANETAMLSPNINTLAGNAQ